MKDKDLIEVLTFILKTQRQQKQQMDMMLDLLTALRLGATPEQEAEIDKKLRERIPQYLSIEPSDDETARKLDEMLRAVDEWAADES